MEMKFKMMKMMMMLALTLLLLVSGSFVAANQELRRKKQILPPAASSSATKVGSSVVFRVLGNVYPIGYYYVEMGIGYPPKRYYLDIDTGSDLTWLHCDAPCKNCPKAPHPLYRLNKNSLVPCAESVCAELHSLEKNICKKPTDQCHYKIQYADQGVSQGALVKDVFPIRLTNGTLVGPRFAIGCGYDQQGSKGTTSPTDGLLGLGKGKASFVSQLQNLGLVRNVFGHCFSGNSGGFLFIGEDLVPSSGIVWTPMSRNSIDESYYSPGPAELYLGKQYIGVKGLQVIFDSGSSYSYFNTQAYKAIISSMMKDLSGKPLEITKDGTLPICWRGAKPFTSFSEVKKYFTPLTLRFKSGWRSQQQMEIPPESYMIISKYGNACLGILNGTEVGLQDDNIIGDNFFQDRVVIYDNEKQKIGWALADCNRISKSGVVLL
ncbi:hypothetical protein C5167_026170 [Papaver somniferum]|uniref:aspartic proteinase Asp1-like n=1 Tax=Papaver somniferum TaxID=3469 RepID=UPI000E703DBD|nr:aspartic proteinase Asp1-like [Papaver somniferum]RZC94439.1 hypothetical protein C5167_026170 [Papaver somniferum]